MINLLISLACAGAMVKSPDSKAKRAVWRQNTRYAPRKRK